MSAQDFPATDIETDIRKAMEHFSLLERSGLREVKVALQGPEWPAVMRISLATYPVRCPPIFVTSPELPPHTPDQGDHRFSRQQICYMKPDMWDPVRHNLVFAIARAAKWLAKWQVREKTGRWPGEGHPH